MAVYYVKNGGSDAAAGTSDATAWATVAKVNTSVSGVSDKVYFKCGSTFYSDLTIDWDGTSGNRVVVGAYYMDGGVETVGVSGNKPIIDGSWNGLYQAACYNLVGSQVLISGDYVTLQDIKIQNCPERGLSTVNGSYAAGTIIQRVDLYNVFNEALVLDYNSGTGKIVQDCTFDKVVQSKPLGCGAANHPAGFTTTNSDNFTFRRNIVSRCGTEGVVLGSYGVTSYNGLVEDNVFYAVAQTAIYADQHQGGTIRRNLVYGTTDTNYSSGGISGVGIAATTESKVVDLNGLYIYNNLLASCGGIAFDAAGGTFTIRNLYVAHNTLVDCSNGLAFIGSAFATSYIEDNIFADYSGTGNMTAPNSGGYDNPPASGITFRYNNWHRAPHVNAQGTGDVTGNPLLVKTSGWHAIAAYGGITAADFALTASSPGRRAGVWAGGYSDTDYLGISRSDPPDIGALVYAVSGGGTALTNGVPVTGLSGSAGTELHYYLTVPSTANNLSFQLSGGTGDADLYVRYAATPDTVNYNCRPYLDGNNETCTMPSATIGTWHVIVRGYTAFSGVSLVASYTAGATGLVSNATNSNSVSQTFARLDWSPTFAGVRTTLADRTYIRFPISFFPTGITIGNVVLSVRSDEITNNSADRYLLGPYNGNGRGDPSTDTGANAYARCDVSADYYINGDAQLTAAGALTWELGAQAVADLTAAIAASEPYFTIAIKQIDETLGTNHYAGIRAYHATPPPTLTISEAAPTSSPSITSVGSGTLNDNDTTVGLFGAAFGATQGNGWLELNSATNGSGTSVIQTILSWANTAIVFNVVKGALSYGTVYAIVHSNNGDKSSGFSVTLQASTPPPTPDPVITGLSTTTLHDGNAGIIITGTNFGASQGNGYVELNTAANGSGSSQTQTITAWGDTSITITVVRGSLPYGRLYLLVHSNV